MKAEDVNHIRWIHDRLVYVYKENKNVDFLIKLRSIIAELEALQQRSCEECVHRSFIDEALTNKVTNGFCIENGFFTKRDFCCNRYEPKEQ